MYRDGEIDTHTSGPRYIDSRNPHQLHHRSHCLDSTQRMKDKIVFIHSQSGTNRSSLGVFVLATKGKLCKMAHLRVHKVSDGRHARRYSFDHDEILSGSKEQTYCLPTLSIPAIFPKNMPYLTLHPTPPSFYTILYYPNYKKAQASRE